MATDAAIETNPDRNYFQVQFDRGDDELLSKKYSGCSISSLAVFAEVPYYMVCSSCEICDSGIDFKYDCSNTVGTNLFNNATNMTELIPGPKVESCIPIADVIPSL
jgi:hypothetical protein